ncbi:AI-2E family transporter [soil metagenome]
MRGAAFALGAALVAAVLLGISQALHVVLIIFLALLLASGLEPTVDWVRARTRLGRGGTILLVYAVFFVTVIALALLIIPGAINQFTDLGTRLLPLLANARAWAESIEPRPLAASLSALINAAQRFLAPPVADQPDPEVVIDLGITVAEVAIALASLLALVFFWLTERARLQRFALALLPHDRRGGARDGWNEIEVRLGSWVRGQLILMGSIGVATSVAYFLIGLEGALLLGFIAALAEAIPLVGPLIGVIPALLVAAMTGQLETVLLVAVVYALIQTVESNVLVPIVMRNTIGIPPFLVLASVLFGAAVGGVMGALLAVPAAAALLVVVERLQAREKRIPLAPATAEEDPLITEPTPAEQFEVVQSRRAIPDATAGGEATRKSAR